MTFGSDLGKQFARNTRYLVGQLEGIDHRQSLAQPEFGANCLNWTVGHMLQYRGSVARLLGVDLPQSDGLGRYEQESDPIVEDGPGVVEFSTLLERFSQTEAPIASSLAATTDDQLHEEIVRSERAATLNSRVLFLYFHDTLHAGQADVLGEFSRRA